MLWHGLGPEFDERRQSSPSDTVFHKCFLQLGLLGGCSPSGKVANLQTKPEIFKTDGSKQHFLVSVIAKGVRGRGVVGP